MLRAAVCLSPGRHDLGELPHVAADHVHVWHGGLGTVDTLCVAACVAVHFLSAENARWCT
eukprot:4237954-Pyramimonas_sp.AAC.1